MKSITFLKRYRGIIHLRFLLLTFFMVGAVSVFADRVYPDMEVVVTNDSNSDYWLKFKYSGNDRVYCAPSDVTYSFMVFRNGDQDADKALAQEEWVAELHEGGTYDYPAGPNNTARWGFRFTGDQNVGPCLKWVWSGYPRAISEEDRNNLYNAGNYTVLSPKVGTVPIKSPKNVMATSEGLYNKIMLTWEKGTDIPDDKVKYRIYRGTTTTNGTLITTVEGNIRTWTDTNIKTNDEFYYWVTTYSKTTEWGEHESPRSGENAVFGRGLSIKASDGLYTNRVKLEWGDLSAFGDEVRLERSVPNSANREELGILSKNARAYNDDSAIPGYKYTYYITPVNSTITPWDMSDTGFKKPDGIIKGYVTSRVGTGVEGVTVCAKPVTTGLPPGAIPLSADGYCATTDNDGYYEIRDIYYFEEAEFTITASKTGSIGAHKFKPESITRKLDLNSRTSPGANFTDQSVFTVSGRITFPDTESEGCGIPGVEIVFNGEHRGIFSKKDGYWSYAIQEEGSFSFTPKFKHHTFENAEGETSTIVKVGSDVEGINFTDTQIDSIKVKVQSACGEPLGTFATVNVISPGGCYNQNYNTDAAGLLTIKNLPARKYEIKLIRINDEVKLGGPNSNIMAQIGNKPIEVDLTVRDTADVLTEHEITTIKPGYTINLPNGQTETKPDETIISTILETTPVEVFPKADFIFYAPLQIDVDFVQAGADLIECTGMDKIVLMEQNTSYKITFEVNEQLGGCPIKEGKLYLYDNVGDKENETIEIPIVDGFATYAIKAGEPNLATEDHTKWLYVVPEVGFLEPEPATYYIVVTGLVKQESSFVTRSPELPWLILHDPPGDNSFASVEKGTSFKSFETTEILVGGDAGGYANLMIGAKVLTPFSTNAFGTKINFSAVVGKDNFNRDGLETTITFNESFSTSTMETLVGHDGDVYIGAAINQEFAFGDELIFDKSTCEFITRTVSTINPTGFATTFIYTEWHIKNILLPKMGELRSTLINGRPLNQLSKEEQAEAYQLQQDSLLWEEILIKNAHNRDKNASFKENKSFSAGAPYGNTYTSSTTSSVSYEYNTSLNIETDIGIKMINETGAWLDSEFGFTASFRWGTSNNSGTENEVSKTVGYILDDNDIGDFFSVDILEDVAYGVPAFRTKLGTTSCPHESGTQPRDKARIDIYPPELKNVPLGSPALFAANLTNLSNSRETREYGVKVISTTNPDGAQINLGGYQINNFGADFYLDFNQTSSVVLTVERGPFASGYDNIGIVMYPTCEMDIWNEGGEILSGDTAWISVHFQSECSNVALHLPGDGWLVNQNNNNLLNVAFTGYDRYNENLESITLQYKREGQGWVDGPTILKEDLLQNFYDLSFDVTGLPDGKYGLRAKAYCGIQDGTSYSSEQMGIIDRSSLAPFGTPSPADGFLRHGQEISVTFDKDINCIFNSYDNSKPDPVFKLYREDGTEIPSTAQCSGRKIIITPVEDLFKQPDLEGVKVYAVVENIQDNSGNVQKYKTEWSFLVNVSPVAWNPKNMHLTEVETEEVIFIATLGNNAGIDKPFTITEWPDWLTPSVMHASILSGNIFPVNLHVDDDLIPGYYEGEVVALVDDERVILNVSLELYAKGINWNIDHSSYEFNMNVVAQFSADAGDINLSTGLRDKIAAFVNGELRGVGNIQYVRELDRYAAFVNIAGNKSGENGSILKGTAFSNSSNAQQTSVMDNGVNLNASRLKKDNWIEYNIIASKSGTYTMEFRLSGILTGKTANIVIDGAVKGQITVPNTGNTNTFTTVSTRISIDEGPHILRFQSVDAEFDLIWINFPEYHVRNKNSVEVIDFRMYDGLNGIEKGAIEKLTFFNDGVIGSVEKPFILHPAGGIQEMVLGKGWTWISVNKENPDMKVSNVFYSITSPQSKNDITLKSQTSYAQYNKVTGWQGPLTTVDLVSGYLIHLSAHADTLSLIGNAPQNDVSISLNPKWNWIGYPKQGVMPANDVLSRLTSNPGDIVKSQFEYAEFNQSINSWVGDLQFFQPGRGYKLFVSNPASLTYLKSASVADQYLKHEYNMTLTAVIEFGMLPQSTNYDLRTYINGQLRGESPLIYIDGLGQIMTFNMIYGDRADVGEMIHTVLWDRTNKKEIELSSSQILFGIDKIAGTITNPVVLTALSTDVPILIESNNFRFDIYPNPFSERAKISYSLPTDSHVIIRITDAFGREISRITDENQRAGSYEFIFEAHDQAPGMYFATIIAGETIQTKKLILHKQ